MRDTLYRITSPILDRIPDISNQPKGRQMSIGLAASLLFHVLLLLLALLVGLILPQHSLVDLTRPKPKLQEIEITVLAPVETETPQIVTPQELEKMKQFLDSTGLAPSNAPPEKPVAESDVDMRAASQKAPTGDIPLPSQEGRKDRPDVAFTDQKAAVGSTAAPAPPPPPPPVTAVQESPPKPQPVEAEKSPPTPLKEVNAASEDEVAISKKSAELAQREKAKSLMRTTVPIAMLIPQQDEPRPERAYREHQEKTRIDGSISNRGQNSVDAEGTPMGRYKKLIRVALGSRWNQYVTGGGGTVVYPPGSVVISFSVDRHGKITDVQSNGNTSTSGYGLTCEKAVRDTQLPPPPKNLFDPLPNGKLDITYTFTIYSPF